MTCVAAQGQLWYESVIFCIWDSLPATGLYIIIKLTFVKWTSQIASKILLSGFCQIFLVPAKVKNSIHCRCIFVIFYQTGSSNTADV